MARWSRPLPPEAPRVATRKAVQLFARLVRLARPEWKTLGLGLVFLAISSATTLVFPQAIRLLVDGALKDGVTGAIDAAALFMLAVAAVSALATGLRFVLFVVTGERVVARLRA